MVLDCGHTLSMQALYGILMASKNEHTQAIKCPQCRKNIIPKLEKYECKYKPIDSYFLSDLSKESQIPEKFNFCEDKNCVQTKMYDNIVNYMEDIKRDRMADDDKKIKTILDGEIIEDEEMVGSDDSYDDSCTYSIDSDNIMSNDEDNIDIGRQLNTFIDTLNGMTLHHQNQHNTGNQNITRNNNAARNNDIARNNNARISRNDIMEMINTNAINENTTRNLNNNENNMEEYTDCTFDDDYSDDDDNCDYEPESSFG